LRGFSRTSEWRTVKAVTPIVPRQQLPKLEDMPEEALNLPYRSIVGKLAFLSHTA
jgi:hypothetical protein